MGHVDLQEIEPGCESTLGGGDMILDDMGQVFRLEIFNPLPPSRSGEFQELHNLETDLDFPIRLTDRLDQLGQSREETIITDPEIVGAL